MKALSRLLVLTALTAGFTIALSPEARAQAPASIVNSKNTRYQLEREVVTRWGKFNPKWYFMLFHNRYRKGPDKRNMLQLMPAMAALSISQAQAEKEQEEVNVFYEQEMYKAADRSLNKSYHLLYSHKITELNRELDLLSLEAIQAGVDAEMLLLLRQEQERINADIGLTKEAYEDDAVKAEAFRGYLKDLVSLRGYYRRLTNLFRASNRLLIK